jgi:hypothetical protein
MESLRPSQATDRRQLQRKIPSNRKYAVDANQEAELILERIGARITNDMSNTTDIQTAVTRADSLQGRVLQPFYQDELTTI